MKDKKFSYKMERALLLHTIAKRYCEAAELPESAIPTMVSAIKGKRFYKHPKSVRIHANRYDMAKFRTMFASEV